MKNKELLSLPKLISKPSLWCINDELGIYNPLSDNAEYFNEETSSWENSPWNLSHILLYMNHPDVEFIGYI